ncbi:hypothetical protein [Mesorhizobium sp. B2-5-3]|uniref:hypothetical protein n=1 Tax=Mesorhizobium sp. B2-5-3 TaxID=2589927 RepID=UPI00112832DA|nr:hypothetical protein [Mesorhizobium sp. B2-5-3]TPK38699.1 hypothetical protein FJ867_08830 [Mesorhizobium sp. B2-5-3]
MSHVRNQLRDWLAANLVGSPQAGSRVEQRRSLPLAKDLRPTFLFEVSNETSTDIDMDGHQQRVIGVRVTACVKDDSSDGEDTLDAMALFVEGVLSDDPTLGGIAQDYAYQATEFNFTGNAERTLCTAALTFAVTVFTARADPETAL